MSNGEAEQQPRQVSEQEALQTLQELIRLTGDTPEEAARRIFELSEGLRAGAHEKADEYRGEHADSIRKIKLSDFEQGKLSNELSGGVDIDSLPGEVRKAIKDALDQLNEYSAEQLREDPQIFWTAYGRLEELTSKIEQQRNLVSGTDDLAALKQLDTLLHNVENRKRQFTGGIGRDELGNVAFSLTGTEIEKLAKSTDSAREVLESWVSEIESRDKFAHQDVNQGLFSKFWSAVAWFATLDYPDEGDPEHVRLLKNDLINEFKSRIELHNMKQAMATNDPQTILQESMNIGSATIFEGFKVSNAHVAFNVYQQFFERYRFRFGEAPEIWNEKENKFVDRFINESGGFVDAFDPEKNDYVKIPVSERGRYTAVGVGLDRISQTHVDEIKSKVDRELTENYHLYGFANREEAHTAAKVGFNVFRASMRMAVHVAKGRISRVKMESKVGYRELRNQANFESDPDEILVNQYNPWQFSIEKWSKMGIAQHEIFDKIMTLLGEGDLDVGHQKMINLLAIPDYFSSGWRIETIFDGLERRLVITEQDMLRRELGRDLSDAENQQAKERALIRMDTLATGLKFKWNKDDKEAGPKAAKNVARFRPLEFAKAYAISIDENGREYTVDHGEFQQQQKFQNMLRTGEFNVGNIEITDYVKLEEILGRYIYPIYEKAMEPNWEKIQGIDIGNPNDDHRIIIDRVITMVNKRLDVPESEKLNREQLQTVYRKLQRFMSDDATTRDILHNPKHDGLHHKTLYMDDAPLGMMEKAMGNLPKISKQFFEIEGGRRDPYARMWGDTNTAATAQEHMWNAINARVPEKLVEELNGVASTLVAYAGRGPYLDLAFNIAAGWLDFAKADMLWGAIGAANKVPWSTSKFERLFGLAAPSLKREELKGVYEQIKLTFGELSFEGKEKLDERIQSELGIEKYKLFISGMKSVALIALFALMQGLMKELENIDE